MKQDVTAIESVLKALADATRLRLLGLLIGGEVCVCDLHDSLRLPQSKVSRHLAYLRRAGLVETRRKGQWIYYRLAEAPDPVVRTIRDAVVHALGHLDAPKRDRKRLEKRTGCCLPEACAPGDTACCLPAEPGRPV
jgi:ArsR family transcriptional regulator